MLRRLRDLRQRQSVLATKRAAQEAERNAAQDAALLELEKDMQVYVDQMRARWRRSMTPKTNVSLRVRPNAAKSVAA